MRKPCPHCNAALDLACGWLANDAYTLHTRISPASIGRSEEGMGQLVILPWTTDQTCVSGISRCAGHFCASRSRHAACSRHKSRDRVPPRQSRDQDAPLELGAAASISMLRHHEAGTQREACPALASDRVQPAGNQTTWLSDPRNQAMCDEGRTSMKPIPSDIEPCTYIKHCVTHPSKPVRAE